MKHNQAYVKPYIINQLSKYYGFKKTDIYLGMSFILGCRFWKTEYEDIYITDYDFINHEDLELKGLFALVYKKDGSRNRQLISNEILKDKIIFECELQSFNYECKKLNPLRTE
jgi:hypothetical protein